MFETKFPVRSKYGHFGGLSMTLSQTLRPMGIVVSIIRVF